MKTKVAILAEIHRYKTCSRAQLDRYLAAFNITPVGVRQRPRLYPDHTAQTILIKLGLAADSAGCGAPGCPAAATISPGNKRKLAALARATMPPRIATMNQLRAERAKGQRRAA